MTSFRPQVDRDFDDRVHSAHIQHEEDTLFAASEIRDSASPDARAVCVKAKTMLKLMPSTKEVKRIQFFGPKHERTLLCTRTVNIYTTCGALVMSWGSPYHRNQKEQIICDTDILIPAVCVDAGCLAKALQVLDGNVYIRFEYVADEKTIKRALVLSDGFGRTAIKMTLFSLD